MCGGTRWPNPPLLWHHRAVSDVSETPQVPEARVDAEAARAMASGDWEAMRRAVGARLGHDFASPELLRDALTHRSFRNERPQEAPADNERLEFLGDAVLGAGVAFLLHEAFPEAREGELTRRRAELVSEGGLLTVAEDLALGAALRLGRGEARSGGRQKPRLLASAVEACLGAVYLDGGPEAALAVVRGLFGERVLTASARRDAKSRLQELVQGRRKTTPRYVHLTARGPDHARVFEAAVEVDGEEVARGEGRSKADAERAAAVAALERLSPVD